MERRNDGREGKHGGFPSGCSDITRMFNLGHRGRRTTQTNTPGSGEQETEQDRKKGGEKEEKGKCN